ncbi:MAG: DNA polymerase III subunit delta' [Gammaproteobacteria bacterium]
MDNRSRKKTAKKKTDETDPLAELCPFFDVLASEAMERPFPWQRAVWNRVLARASQGRLPQSWLIEGQAGLGKTVFAYWWMQWLHCAAVHLNAPQGETATRALIPQACGRCSACVQVRANTHADCHWVRPEQVGGQIKIDQIRDVIRFLSQTAKHGAHRVVLIEPVEAMNPAAQNALLKTLEEPGEGTYFLLVSHRSVRILPTIVSRCQRVRFAVPTSDVVLAWLQRLPAGVLPSTVKPEEACSALPAVSGSPLALLAHLNAPWRTAREKLVADLTAASNAEMASRTRPADLVDAWLEWPAEDRVTVVIQWVQGRIKTAMMTVAALNLVPPTSMDPVVVTRDGLRQAFALYDELMGLYRLAVEPNSINERLLWENVLITWEKLTQVLPTAIVAD